MATTEEGDDRDPAHGVHGSQRDDSKMQEEPEPSGQADEAEWADRTETGGDATR